LRCRYDETSSVTRNKRFNSALVSLLEASDELPANELVRVVELAGEVLGAESATMLVADYGLTSLQPLGTEGSTGPSQPVTGTLAGRAFERGEVVISGDAPATLLVPLSEGSERLGVLELVHASWDDEARGLLDTVARVLVLVLVSKRRYTDVVLRARRTQPLDVAAEMQWDLLPPLTCATTSVSVSGILEPAYSIGGDSFDYAVNPRGVEFAVIDAVGHGISAVLLAVAAITSLRNSRREGVNLEATYHAASELIEEQFGDSKFVTAQFGSLSIDSGELTWLNAGHPPPLLMRDGRYVGELSCQPSWPLGLGGVVHEIATQRLQPGDRVLFFTDGVVEAKSTDGEDFGVARLADFLVRASLDQLSQAETVRRLSASVLAHNGATLSDDASLLLVDYHGTGT
jgi:serine phosphatase RsbU (regulator of sigma subunit)